MKRLLSILIILVVLYWKIDFGKLLPFSARSRFVAARFASCAPMTAVAAITATR